MVSYWLFKEEPTHYSFEDLVRDGRTVWDGVHNNLALKHLRSVRKGDLAYFYHTGSETAVVGTMKMVSDSYPNPEERDARYVVVDVEPLERLPRPVTLAEIKANPEFKRFELLRIPRLSVMPLPPPLWEEIRRMAHSK